MEDSDPIDPAALARLVEWGGDKLHDQMIRLFLENADVRVQQIRSGFDEGSIQEVERGAHSLKSSAANVGARELSGLAQRMEDAGSRGALEEARTLQEPLLDAHRRAVTRLREILERGQS